MLGILVFAVSPYTAGCASVSASPNETAVENNPALQVLYVRTEGTNSKANAAFRGKCHNLPRGKSLAISPTYVSSRSSQYIPHPHKNIVFMSEAQAL